MCKVIFHGTNQTNIQKAKEKMLLHQWSCDKDLGIKAIFHHKEVKNQEQARMKLLETGLLLSGIVSIDII